MPNLRTIGKLFRKVDDQLKRIKLSPTPYDETGDVGRKLGKEFIDESKQRVKFEQDFDPENVLIDKKFLGKRGILVDKIRKSAEEEGFWESTVPKLIGGGVAAGGVLGAPEDSEAMPLGKLTQIGKVFSKLKGSSSSAKRLIGQEVNGRVIKNVHKADKNWRHIEFEDGSVLPMTTDYLNDLSRALGTKKYVAQFNSLNKPARVEQAKTGLETRLSRLDPVDEELFRKEHEAFLERVKEIDPMLMPRTKYVKYPANDPNQRIMQMPEEYADILANEGLVTIVGNPGVK